MNVAELGERNLERFGRYDSLVFNGTTFTNEDLLGRAARLAAGLRGLGITLGDRVGVMLPNSPDVGVAYASIWRAGGVAMPMLFLLAPPEVRYILEDSGAVAIITAEMFLPTVTAALEGMTTPPRVIVTGTPAYEELAGADRLDIIDRAADDLAVIAYTSGTTGAPKGVMLTHDNLLFNAENSASVAATRDGDIAIGCLPLAHLFGIGAGLSVTFYKIKTVLLEWFTAEGFFEAVNTHKVTSSALVPTMVQFMLGHADFDSVDWSSMRYVVVGASPLPVETAKEFERRTGARVLEGYGLTETSPTTSVMRIDEHRPGSCGRPAPNVSVQIRGSDGDALPPGERGEVCIKGRNIMAGYYNRPDATAEAVRDGWFHSGDVGYLDEDGFLYITDRTKDLIIRGGLNVYPTDVEATLYEHPAVIEAAVVGAPDAALGEQVHAFVVTRPGMSADEADLLAHCKERLATYKTPVRVHFRDVLPKNAVGKILKRELRDELTPQA